MIMLSRHTWIAFGTWMTIGLVVYAMYGYSNSRRAAAASELQLGRAPSGNE
jgi:preprotein translocase subunit SecG